MTGAMDEQRVMDEQRTMRALMVSDRLYSKLKHRAKQLTRERRAHVTYSQVLAELLEDMPAPGWAWNPSTDPDTDPASEPMAA